ncbi:ArsR/SmtB family transcription factor [Aureimonas mangrovi]|uniref:ArsR/SmtB family transcription factor n=1 Tax=Aureimonas mangrovi TaxID=2758041 RepID=UPI001FE920EE|nr:metalloregulator ArsR/SmtB family transcription factor [Aureimonas mangrovi]
MTKSISFDLTVERLKALGEPTRLRLALLLSRQDLTVSDLVFVLGQSQPRISRHLKLLMETGILLRYQEGAWAYFRVSDEPGVADLLAAACEPLSADDAVLARDVERLEAVRLRRAEHAARYFAENAESWDRIRSLHVPDAQVEAALVEALGPDDFESILDVGTGTGRMLELLAGRARRAVGIDASREMLAVARAKLDAAELSRVSVRQGNAYHLPVEPRAYDLVTLHQVLHYLDDPQAAVREAARALAPGGRLAVVDFALHGHEFLREDHAHVRLGFSADAIEGFLRAVDLEVETIRLLEPTAEGGDQLTVLVAIGRDCGAASEPAALKISA